MIASFAIVVINISEAFSKIKQLYFYKLLQYLYISKHKTTTRTVKMSHSKIIKLVQSMKPTRMWIDGKCYNIGRYDENKLKDNIASSVVEEYKTRYNITFANDLYYTSFRLPVLYYDKLQKFPQFTIKDLEEYTNSSISIPQQNSECLTVSSKDIGNVIDARTKLHAVLSTIRETQAILQFISIPTINEDIKKKFAEFKKEILQNEKIEGMHESIFQKAERLHLTISVFSLLDESEITEAIKELNECKERIISPVVSKTGSLRIQLCGLDCMNDNYKKANILYVNAKICAGDDENILQQIANSISKHFYEKGLIRQYQESVKIHATLINTKYRKIEGRKRKWADRRKTFDASVIMEKYKNFCLGECQFSELHLSWIRKIDDSGFYKPLSIITI